MCDVGLCQKKRRISQWSGQCRILECTNAALNGTGLFWVVFAIRSLPTLPGQRPSPDPSRFLVGWICLHFSLIFFFFFSVLLGVGMELIHFWTGFFYLLFDTGTGLHLFVIPFVLILFCGSFCFMPWLKCTLGGNGHESLFQIVTILIFTGKWNSNKICVFPFGMWIDQTVVPLYLAFQSWKWRLIIQWTRTILHAHFLR